MAVETRRPYISLPYATDEEWHALRATGIGSSDAATVLGYNPYQSPARLFDVKVGIASPDDLSKNEAVELGTLLEDDVLELYMRRTGNVVHRVRQVRRSVKHPFMVANLDARVVGQSRLVEAKTAGLYAHKNGDWGDAEIEPDRIPTQYLCQVQHQLAVCGYDVADLPLLVGGQRLIVYSGIERDEAFIANLIALEAEFWGRVENARTALDLYASSEHTTREAVIEAIRVQEPEAPLPAIAQEALALVALYRPLPITYDEAAKRWPEHARNAVQATPEVATVFERFCSLSDEQSARKREIDDCKKELALFLQDADTLLIENTPALTWREQTRAAHSVAESSSRVMRRVKGAK